MTLMLRDLSAGKQCRHPKHCPNMLILRNLDTDWLVIWNSIVLMLRPFEYCAHMTEEHSIYTLILRPRQKSRHFAHNFANDFNYFFLKYENYFSIQISVDLLTNCPVERSQHWFKQLSGIEQVTGQYLNMMTSSYGSIFRVTGHLCGEFTGPRWIPCTKARDAELWCFHSSLGMDEASFISPLTINFVAYLASKPHSFSFCQYKRSVYCAVELVKISRMVCNFGMNVFSLTIFTVCGMSIHPLTIHSGSM